LENPVHTWTEPDSGLPLESPELFRVKLSKIGYAETEAMSEVRDAEARQDCKGGASKGHCKLEATRRRGHWGTGDD